MRKLWLVFLGITLLMTCCSCSKSSKASCIRNLDYYKAALKIILENKALIVAANEKPKDPKWEAQVITKASIEKLYLNNPVFQPILQLWERQLISDDYGIMIASNRWNSIDFDLPGEGRFLCFLPSNNFTFTCASGLMMVHERLEKDWYYVHYCPE